MPTINQLNQVTQLYSSDQLPIYSNANGDARKASLNQLLQFIETSFAPPSFTNQVSAPSASGFNVQVADSGNNVWLILNPLAVYAAGTITLPAVANAVDGQEIMVSSTQTVTALTVNGNGAVAVYGAPVTLSANGSFTLRYYATQKIWYNISALNTAVTAAIATFLATPSSANLAAAVTDETGTGSLVFATSPTLVTPTLVTPTLGTPASGTLTNCTGLPVTTGVSGLGAGIATFLATPSSANLATAVTDETGTGSLVFGTGPTINWYKAGVQSLSGPGAVNLTTQTTAFTSTAAGNALTLADGTAGQIKNIVYIAEAAGADTGVLTPTNFGNGTTITFNAVGDSVMLQFLGTKWWVVALNGAAVA